MHVRSCRRSLIDKGSHVEAGSAEHRMKAASWTRRGPGFDVPVGIRHFL